MVIKCDYYCYGMCSEGSEGNPQKAMKDCNLIELQEELQRIYVPNCARKNLKNSEKRLDLENQHL